MFRCSYCGGEYTAAWLRDCIEGGYTPTDSLGLRGQRVWTCLGCRRFWGLLGILLGSNSLYSRTES